MPMTDDTALADRLEGLGLLTGMEDAFQAARRLRELGAEVERLNGEIVVLREAAGANNDPEFWLIRIRLGNDLLYEAEVKVEAAEARIAELEAERAWRHVNRRELQEEIGYSLNQSMRHYPPNTRGMRCFNAAGDVLRALDRYIGPLPAAPTERGTEEGNA